MVEKVTSVRLGELKWGNHPSGVLATFGLGSCIALTAYDPAIRLGAMVHIILPDSSLARQPFSPAKFADTAVPLLLETVLREGAARARLQVKMAGGARVLAIPQGAKMLDIGTRNIEAVMQALQKERIPLAGCDVGGNHGRTMKLYLGTGRVTVAAIGQGEKEL